MGARPARAAADAVAEALPSKGPRAGRTAAHPIAAVAPGGNRQAIRRMQDDGASRAPSLGEAVLEILQGVGRGRPLPPELRAGMELALGADLGAVRIHTDQAAGDAASELDAEAFTIDQDVYFGRGRFRPGSGGGRDLIAHELAHTLAPGGGGFDPAQVDAQPPDPMASQAEPVEAVVAEEPPPTEAPDEAAVEAEAETTVEAEAETRGESAPEAGGGEGDGEAGGGGGRGGGGTGGGAATDEEEGGGAPSEGRPDIELLMPPPPSEPSDAHRERVGGAQARAGAAGTAVRQLPSSDTSTEAARGAVTEPEAETRGRAEGGLAQALTERPEPSPELVELCETIRESIREKRPVDEDELVEAEPEAMAQDAGADLNASVEGDAQRVEGSYADLDQPPEGTPALDPQAVDVPPEAVGTPAIGADEAVVPDPLTPEQTDLGPDVDVTDQQIEDAGLNREPAQLVEDGPPADVRATRADLGETAERGPAEVLREQEAAFQSARGDMAALQERATASLLASRAGTVGGVAGQQTAMVGSEEQMREQLSTRARDIFTAARDQVTTLLEPLPETAMELWETGVARHATTFRDQLDRVARWIEERHSGVGGFLLSGWDALTGLPDWVTDSYDRAEQRFGDDVCQLILDISTEVNAVIAAAEALIEQARQDIDNLFSQDLPEELRTWAEAERQRIQGQLDGLASQVAETRDGVNRDLARSAVRAVREVQDEVAELREAAKGLIGKIADAIGEFLDDPVKFIINGLLKLLGISPTSFWRVVAKIQQVASDIADDPLGFANNLVSAIGQGFQQFFDNVLKHLLDGFLEWLFGKVEGLEVPSDFSLESVVTFFLQVMGITWPNIREILVRVIGEENVELIEKAWELISTLIEQGPAGIVEMIEDRLNPMEILNQVIDAAVDFMIDALIAAVTPRIIALFNPAGAILQAIEIVFRVLKWVFENAAKIFSLIETIVNGIADIVAGNISAMANAIENALAGLIAPVIDFLAGFFGMGDLPDKVQETIEGMRSWVLGLIESAIVFLADKAKQLLEALGLSDEEETEEEPDEAAADADTELGKVVSFRGAGEGHRQWVAFVGDTPELMVASEPMTIDQRLDRWEGLLDVTFAEDPDGRKQAVSAIRATRALLNEAEVSAQKIGAAYRTANRIREADDVEPLPSDDPLERKQEAIVTLLSQLFTLFDEDEEQDVEAIHAFIGKAVVERGTGPSDPDERIAGISLPEGYSLNLTTATGRYHIQRTGTSDEPLPAVHIDDNGILREGGARPEPVDDATKIAEYEKILSAAEIPSSQWPTDSQADPYRRKMRTMIVTKFHGDLPGLDAGILSPVIVPSQFNGVIGSIFEHWVAANNKGILRAPRPAFIKTKSNGLKRDRDADGRKGPMLVEVKAISGIRGPESEEEEQIEDYNRIVTPPGIPWIQPIPGNKPKKSIFTEVKYFFNNLEVARAWKPTLDAVLGSRVKMTPRPRK